MCGISGILSLTGSQISKKEITDMNRSIIHRGPDADGFFIEDNIALGHRRLSIIDLNTNANQPFFYKDKYVLVFNGEIYNYLEIRQELKSLGYKFSTNSDTEVLLKSYVQWGENCLDKFNGMWAFSIWDRKNKKLFCSRDRYGIKPFYWSNSNNKFFFGSEIKQIKTQNIRGKCNLDELSIFLYSGCANSSEETFYDGIKALPPGNSLTVSRDGLINIKVWYSLRDRLNSMKDDSDPDEFNCRLESAIKLRMRSDVLIGSSLSGGLDSSAVVNLASKFITNNNQNIKLSAIHANANDPFINETKYAEIASKLAGCNLIVLEPSYKDFLDLIKEIIFVQDEPFASKSIFMQYFVMQKAKTLGCKVMLDGQGSDEILFGYVRSFLVTLLSSYTDYGLKGVLEHSIYSLKRNNKLSILSMIKYMIGNISGRARAKYLKNRLGFLKLPIESTKNLYKSVSDSNNNPIESQIIEIEKTSLPQILRTEDRNSMANSIEARVPFLDFNLVEYCLNLTTSEKVKKGWTKYPLRNSGILPKELAWRKSKLGFDAPEDYWDKKYSQEMLKKIRNSPLINQISNMEELLQKWHKLSSRERWRIFNVAYWQELNNIDF